MKFLGKSIMLVILFFLGNFIGGKLIENFNPSISTIKQPTVCFVPGDDCEGMIVGHINQAKSSIDVQAYHLTNERIVLALMLAEQHGVKIRVILDKAAEKEALPLRNEGIPVWIDYKRAIAHNKVLIIDGKEYGTGSFNFSEAAQKRNVENYTFISSKFNAQKYEDNFMNRLSQSRVVK